MRGWAKKGKWGVIFVVEILGSFSNWALEGSQDRWTNIQSIYTIHPCLVLNYQSFINTD